MPVHALDTLRTAMVAAGRARHAAYARKSGIAAAEAFDAAASKAYFAEYDRCCTSADPAEVALAAAHLAVHVDTLRSTREPEPEASEDAEPETLAVVIPFPTRSR